MNEFKIHDLPIGSTLRVYGARLKVVKSNGSCDGCYFDDKENGECKRSIVIIKNKITLPCLDAMRKDGKSIIFENITDEKK